MERLFDLAENFSCLFDNLDEIESMEFPKNESGDPVDADGNVIDPKKVKDDMREAWMQTFDAMSVEFSEKAENVARYIKNLKAESDAIDAEIKKMQSRSKTKKNRVEWLKKYLMQCMEMMQLKKVEGATAKISIRTNAPSVRVDDEPALIRELESRNQTDALKYQDPEIRKTVLKTLLKSGETFENARLESSKSLTIS